MNRKLVTVKSGTKRYNQFLQYLTYADFIDIFEAYKAPSKEKILIFNDLERTARVQSVNLIRHGITSYTGQTFTYSMVYDSGCDIEAIIVTKKTLYHIHLDKADSADLLLAYTMDTAR